MQQTPQSEMVAVTNDKAHTIHRNGVAILPGETRHFPAPPKPVAAAPTADPDAELLAILDRKVSDVVAALPDLTLAQIDRLEQAEQDGNTRKGVMEGIAAERLRRASSDPANPADEARADIQAEELAALDDVELLELAADTDDETLRGMIAAEQARREAAA